jgi:SAM-dependent methyltransferase
VIGRRTNLPEWASFQQRWGMPDGYHTPVRRGAGLLVRRLGLPIGVQARVLGPFGFQPGNNSTRRFEYPWAFHAVPVDAGKVVVDLGGSLGGLQFVLSRAGAKVINVDPGESAAMGWRVTEEAVAALNRAFATSVELRSAFLHEAGLADGSVDTLYSISTLEHVPVDDLDRLAGGIGRILRPGGHAVLTVDLFYDLSPFTARATNVHGRNIDLCAFVAASGLRLLVGDPAELCGYPEFDPSVILGRATEFVQGDVALNTAQALVLVKDPW